MPMPGQALQRIGLGERLQSLCIEFGAAREIFDVGEGPAVTARGDAGSPCRAAPGTAPG